MREDGYINATQLCKAGGKKFNDYSRLDNTKDFLQILKTNTGQPAIKLIESKKGQPAIKLIESKKGQYGGTWVHRKVAIHLAQWISPQFSVQVTNWVEELLTKGRVDISRDANPPTLPTPEFSLNPLSFYNKDVFYNGSFEPDVSEIDDGSIVFDDGKQFYKFGVTHDIKTRLETHQREFKNFKLKDIILCNFKLKDIILCTDGYNKSIVEKRMKTLLKESKLCYEYKNHKETYIANRDEIEQIMNELRKCHGGSNDDIEILKIRNSCELVKHKMDIELQKHQMDIDIELQKRKLKTDTYYKLFSEGTITFDQFSLHI
jgi:hypothetical protein